MNFGPPPLTQNGLNTGILYDSLLTEYGKAGKPITVDFRRLVSWVKLGDQLTHQIHAYPAKLLPNIASFFINVESFFENYSNVLDPFSGSGTVALEASLSNKNVLYADANPLACLITKVKTYPYDEAVLRRTLKLIMTTARRIRKAPSVDVVNEAHWYSVRTKKRLEILLRAIRVNTENEVKDFFEVCFSSAARKLSYADPRISVPVKLKVKDSLSSKEKEKIEERILGLDRANVFDEFERICLSNLSRISQANTINSSRKVAVFVGNDARNLCCPANHCEPLASESVDLIITSPPYGSAQKYIRASSLSINWLGLASPKELSRLEGATIGREHIPKQENSNYQVSLGYEFETMLADIAQINLSRAKITKTYLHEMKLALYEIARVLSPGGKAVIVIGNNTVCGYPLRNDEFCLNVMNELGLKIELHLLDDIKSRGLMTKRNKTASIITRESVLVFKKV
ncbi:hypothetical protein ACOJCM_08025 [Billgrantia sp. LNSP4103-1]|uniref:hypothetical protein n=1 Tax=Billgrantia sp. LNSP4103-1 TaxID=3410266 RepID=UPI00403F071F